MKLEGWEYDEIEETVNCLFEDLGFSEFPVDPFEVASRLKIKVKKYSEIPLEDRNMVISKYEDGFSSLIAKSKYIIYYDEKIFPKTRIKFTIWYEIAHIQLGHFDGKYKTQERMQAECRYFAKYALAPLPFVLRTNPKNSFDIEREFDVSSECAKYIFCDYINSTRYFSITNKILSSRILDILQDNKSKIL